MKSKFGRFMYGLFAGSVLFFALGIGIPSIRFLALVLGSICFGLFVLKVLNRWADRSAGILSSIIHWVHSGVFEIFALLLMWCLRFLSCFWKFEMRKGEGRPILLVHGYMHDSSAWMYHMWRLKREGFGPIYVLNLGYPFLPIGEYAKRVGRKAEEIEQETGRKDLVLIGHSMGGIVSSFYATQVAPKGKVTDVITVGSPLGGTYVAKIAIGPNGKQMWRGNGFLKDLRKSILSSEGIRFYHMGTKTDELVIPYTSAFIPESGGESFMVNDIGHLSLLYSPRIADQMIAWLKRK